MIHTTAIALLASGAVLVSASTALAQFGDRSLPRDGACFYEDANYRGSYFCVDSGQELSSLPSGTNDRVSSIRIFGRAEVTVFEDPRFRGNSRQVESDIRDLRIEDFNDEISSIQVSSRSSGGARRSAGGPRFGSPNPEAIVRRAYQDVLERDPDPAGMRTYRSRIIDDGWTEQEVRQALRESPEYREKNRMTRAKAEEIVRNAYLAVLNREPDAGSRGYVERVLRDRWSQADVERELRRSPEYRVQRR
jgi:hypothetical protein